MGVLVLKWLAVWPPPSLTLRPSPFLPKIDYQACRNLVKICVKQTNESKDEVELTYTIPAIQYTYYLSKELVGSSITVTT